MQRLRSHWTTPRALLRAEPAAQVAVMNKVVPLHTSADAEPGAAFGPRDTWLALPARLRNRTGGKPNRSLHPTRLRDLIPAACLLVVVADGSRGRAGEV